MTSPADSACAAGRRAATQRLPEEARVLVVSDHAADAGEIVELLQGGFAAVQSALSADQALADLDAFQPDVLVLAFHQIEQNQRYVQRVLRRSRTATRQPRRSIVLCRNDEVRATFELCRKGVFDDYVQYWPHVHDGLRLTMSAWCAARDLMAAATPTPDEVATHVGHAGTLRAMLGEHHGEGAQHAALVDGTLREAENAVSAALDDFSQRLATSGGAAGVQVTDPARFAGEFERLKKEPMAAVFRRSARALAPVSTWAERLADKLAPHLHGLQSIGEKRVRVQPVVLVVEDDEFGRQMTEIALEGQGYALTFAHSGRAALALLRRVQPDLILMDVNLPDIDGVALTQQLKSNPALADIPVLMVTGDARRETIHNSIRAGAADFVVKPFTRGGLVSKLERVLYGVPTGKAGGTSIAPCASQGSMTGTSEEA